MMRKPSEVGAQVRHQLVPFGLMKLVILLVMPLLGAAQSADRIRAVETGLMPAVVVKGRPVPRHTIEERMKALNVSPMSTRNASERRR